jgi:hypothetical protein
VYPFTRHDPNGIVLDGGRPTLGRISAAFRVGANRLTDKRYARQASLTRAVRRWTGRSPRLLKSEYG